MLVSQHNAGVVFSSNLMGSFPFRDGVDISFDSFLDAGGYSGAELWRSVEQLFPKTITWDHVLKCNGNLDSKNY